MEARGASGNGGLWWGLTNFHKQNKPKKPNREPKKPRAGSGSDSVTASIGSGYQFPLKQALTAGSLALTGDTIAQLSHRFHMASKRRRSLLPEPDHNLTDDDLDTVKAIFADHDWLRALRMASYGFLLYGPGTYAWYQYLDRCFPKQTVENLMLKVLLNQVVLGPCVIAVVFAWNNLWLGKLSQLPKKYQNYALPTLFNGFKFWIPVSILNFWVIPLQARVAFMSLGSIFWNFYLSLTMSK